VGGGGVVRPDDAAGVDAAGDADGVVGGFGNPVVARGRGGGGVSADEERGGEGGEKVLKA